MPETRREQVGDLSVAEFEFNNKKYVSVNGAEVNFDFETVVDQLKKEQTFTFTRNQMCNAIETIMGELTVAKHLGKNPDYYGIRQIMKKQFGITS
jgi:hypothetical protein